MMPAKRDLRYPKSASKGAGAHETGPQARLPAELIRICRATGRGRSSRVRGSKAWRL